MITYFAFAWYCGRQVQVQLTYNITQERGYQVSRLVWIEQIEPRQLRLAA